MVALAHYAVIAYGVEMMRKCVPRGLTFSESFSLMALNAHYLTFYIDTLAMKLRGNAGFVAGNVDFNLLIFVPVTYLLNYI